MTDKSFLQSDDWGRFQEAVGLTVLKHNGYQFFETSIPMGKYLYCPHPLFYNAQEFIAGATELAKQNKAWFVRLEPNVGSANLQTAQNIHSTLPSQPGRTLHIPLADDETMLAAMHQKTRYNMRVAEKAGVRISFSNSTESAEALIRLLERTGERAGIRLHPSAYYEKMLDLLGGTNPAEGEFRVEVALAEHDGVNVAGALLGWWGDTVIYLHGGSNYERRSLMAPHLLHWTAMRRARDAGKTIYDMGGISPDDQPNHPWAGISRFKLGFGGNPIDYLPAVDVVLNEFSYKVYGLARKLRRSVK